MQKMGRKWIAGFVCSLFSVAAQAHDFWIEPSSFRPQPGERVELSLMQGVDLDGNSLPYVDMWFSEFVQVDRAGARPVESPQGRIPAGEIVSAEGTTLIGYQSTRRYVALKPDKFLEYLHEEGLEHAIEAREKYGESDREAREFFGRCAKAVLSSGNAGDASDVYRRELGFVLELIPEQNPYTLGAGDKLVVQLLYRGEPEAGVLVVAFNKENPREKIRVRTPEDGRVHLELDRKGVWLFKAVKLDRLRDEEEAEWESFWASLLFEIR